jgi:glycosyltransferase involved in cell wall biosynthesis
MANVFVNGLKSKTGGGKSILNNYLELLHISKSTNKYYVLTPDRSEYSKYSNDHIEVIDISSIYKKNSFFPVLYYFVLPNILRRYNIDVIFNLGDIIIPSSTQQLYLFDWAYAVYPDSIVWKRMDIKSLLVRKIKIFAIKWYLKNATTVIAQTKTIRDRLSSVYGLNNVEIIPNAVTLENLESKQQYNFSLPEEKFKLLYLSNYSSHKNVDILIPLAIKIKASNLPYCLIVTIDRGQHKYAGKFVESIEKFGLQKVLINIGYVDMDKVPSLYDQCDALLMPTLLESYGLPYVEAMYHKRTILTSDLDFAQDVCGDAAFYFDPLDADSILKTINQAFENDEVRIQKIKNGNSKIDNLLTWEQVFQKYHSLLECCIKKGNQYGC